MSPKVSLAAGSVTVRDRPGKEPHVLLIHRPAYGDWSLPKGHLEPDEYEAVAAGRETWEETGVTVALRQPLGAITYPVTNGTKVVHYWRGVPVAAKKRKPDKEVDKVAWLTPANALARMSYDDERDLLRRSLDLGPTTPFLIVRHAKAMERKHWSGRDQSRPVTARGRKQSKRLIPLLRAFGVGALASSTSTRCVQTLEPYGRLAGLRVDGWQVLTEEIGEENPAGVTQLVKRLARQAAGEGVPTAVCGHRPVLPTMLAALGIPNRPMQTAAAVIAHLDEGGEVVATEFHRPRC